MSLRLPEALYNVGRSLGIFPSRYLLVVSVQNQCLALFETCSPGCQPPATISMNHLPPFGGTSPRVFGQRAAKPLGGDPLWDSCHSSLRQGSWYRCAANLAWSLSMNQKVGLAVPGEPRNGATDPWRTFWAEEVRSAASSARWDRRALPILGSRPRFASNFWRLSLPMNTLHRSVRISTSRFGVGQQSGSNQTPRGLHRIVEKIGGGHPIGTVFRSRRPVGLTWKGCADAAIVHRILWLEGLEPGHNQGGDVDSRARFIYIHGTGDEPSLGRPASRGCIHVAADDLLPLYDLLPVGTMVWIE